MTTQQKPAFYEPKKLSLSGIGDGWWLIDCAIPDDEEFGPRLTSYAVQNESDARRIVEAANALYDGGWDVPACNLVMDEVKKLSRKRQVASWDPHTSRKWQMGD